MSKMLAIINKSRPQPDTQPPKAEQRITREEQFGVQLTLALLAKELGDELGDEGITWDSSRPAPKAKLGLYGLLKG